MPRTAGTTRRMRAVLAAGLATAVLGPVGATSAAAADPPFVPGPAVSVLGEYTPIPGDFDGDGRDDIAWYRPGTGRDHLWQGTADGFVEGPRVNVDGNYTLNVSRDGSVHIFGFCYESAPGGGCGSASISARVSTPVSPGWPPDVA